MLHQTHIPRFIAITPPEFLMENNAGRIVEQALDAGLPAIMLRDKSPLPDSELIKLSRWLRPITRARGALLIVNRRPELARAIEADGIHLGANGPSIAEARSVLGERGIVGWSAHSPAEAMHAFDSGCDYVTLSPIFASPKKGRPLGLEPLRDLTRQTGRPVIALGGIAPENAREVLNAGAHGLAAIRGILDQPNPAPAVKLFVGLLVSSHRSH